MNIRNYMYKVEKAKEEGNLFNKSVCYFLDLFGYSNCELQDLERRNKVYNYCKRKYFNHNDIYKYPKIEDESDEKVIWICWLQGIDNAPEIVKACLESVKKWAVGYKIVILDDSNLLNYVKLQDHIIDKWKRGLITNTLFSDFIRLSVLSEFGGIWMDATVFLTGELPEFIENSTFFLYATNSYDKAKFGESWLIKSRPHNRILMTTLDYLSLYWEKENKIRDYFLMFIFMKLATELYKDDIKDLFFVPNNIPHLMQLQLNNKFSESTYKYICNVTSVHKLTYKNIMTESDTYTFYDYIIGKKRR